MTWAFSPNLRNYLGGRVNVIVPSPTPFPASSPFSGKRYLVSAHK